jgi:hypothetical protein
MEEYPIILGMGADSFCNGNEEFFSDCLNNNEGNYYFTDYWEETCTHDEDLGVVCVIDDSVHSAYPTGKLDIHNPITNEFTGYTTGGLVIYVSGYGWGTVCDDSGEMSQYLLYMLAAD